MLIIFDTIKELLEKQIPCNRKVFIIVDSNVGVVRDQIKDLIINNSLPSVKLIDIFTGEENKTLYTVEKIIGNLMSKGADRNSFIIGVGGGITTDIVGFTASIYKRGVDFAFIPTTLLAQTDASIGGKNGVNFNGYKNIVGVINQPEWIAITPEVLRTLNPREFRAGIAEMLKTFIIFDHPSYNRAVEYFKNIHQKISERNSIIDETTGKIYNEDTLKDLIKICANHKIAVVNRDEFEKGERRILNLGHTFAHAIEKEFNYPDNKFPQIMHGEAVALGVIMAAELAGNSEFIQTIKDDFKECGFPTTMQEFIAESYREGRYNNQYAEINNKRIISHIKSDKKIEDNKIHLILPYDFSDVRDIMEPVQNLGQLALRID